MGRFLNADTYIATGLGLLGNNMFAYCNNNPVMYKDHTGRRLQICPLCGSPYPYNELIYETDYNSIGKLYEYWNDPNTGKHVWCRHHTTHGNPTKHTDPHDHEWKDDDNGNNKPGPPLPPNPNYTAPGGSKSGDISHKETIGNAATLTLVCVVAYVGIKWILATIAAPVTGGGSLVVASITP